MKEELVKAAKPETVGVAVETRHEKKSDPIALLRPDPGLVLWTWIIFITLLLFFKKFGLKPLLGSMEKREKLLADAVVSAQETQKALANIERQRIEVLTEARRQMDEILRKGRVVAEANARKIVDDAKIAGDRQLADAKKSIELEKKAALESLKDAVIDLSLAAGAKLAGKELGSADNRQYVEKIITELSKT